MALRLLALLGGLIGFIVGIGLGWLNHCQAAEAFWRASVTALAAGWLMRWWGRVWVQSLQQAMVERKAEASATKEAKVGPAKKA